MNLTFRQWSCGGGPELCQWPVYPAEPCLVSACKVLASGLCQCEEGEGSG